MVLPLVPVTPSHGCPAGRSRQASSTSPQTGTPRLDGRRQQGLLRPPAGRGDDELDTVRQLVGTAQADLDAQGPQLRGDDPLAVAVPPVDGDDPGAAGGQRPGRGRPRHSETGHADGGPVEIHAPAPVTHSA